MRRVQSTLRQIPYPNNNRQVAVCDIQGTWKTNDPENRYTGTLIIDFDRITITGYNETQTPTPDGNDLERPYRNFTKGITLEGYTEEQEETGQKVMLIKDAGTWQEGIPYTYWTDNPPPQTLMNRFIKDISQRKTNPYLSPSTNQSTTYANSTTSKK